MIRLGLFRLVTIVAVAIPSLTNEFKTIDDIGWYSAVYGLIFSSMNFFFGKMYTLFSLKTMYIVSVFIFELGSVICTFAPTSKVFIFGRAVAGLGAAGQGAGSMAFISRCFPNHKRPVANGFLGFAQSFGLVSAPIIGGALTDAFTWRACFGINVPIGVVAIAITALWMKDPFPNPDLELPIREKLKRIDPFGTLLILPSIVCLMMGLQWGGSRYGWQDWRIILLFALFLALVVGFAYVQHRQQDKAILPPRILKNRTVLASALFTCCTNGLLAVTEYYIAIYFQGVRGYTATRAGILGLPMIAGLALASIGSAFGTTWVGYYTPFMLATSVLAPIATGILTTIDLDDSQAKVAALLGFIGVAVGVGVQQPFTATMTVMPPKDVSVALGVLIFGAGIGSSLFVAVSATLFQSRLAYEVSKYAPGSNMTALGHAGLSEIRKTVGSDHLKDVLFGYNEAVIQTLYLPLGLALLTIVGSAFTEIKSVKKKRE
ncbi:hypothetical protein LTR24_006968 [Lithohypha guttulata]|uniref:Major facilitator superfamily (MFS) profile domain-containing protein n=1 Tax=Lithohypha guttulata TaxID=1690604 RepID=A0ABR0K4G3_9EURO|nr:hypothetical protein LTR24_006968 [Lithohypha guttulata]